MEVQTLIFPRSRWTRAQAVDWARAHNYRAAVDATSQSFRLRQQNPHAFTAGSLRHISFGGSGPKAVVGCPRP